MPEGSVVRCAGDLAVFVEGESTTLTFVIDEDGALRVAPRRSEHVACARGRPVLSAGELTIDRSLAVAFASNQSTGYCPEPDSWPAVARALDELGVKHPRGFSFEATFRRCERCGERNLVKDQVFECAICGAELPRTWNFE